MATKVLKALVDLGTSLGYTGEDLKQCLNDERMRADREKEKVEELKRGYCTADIMEDEVRMP